MKIKLSQKLVDIQGTVLKEGDTEITLGKLACNALLTAYQGEENLAGDEKARRYKLALEIVKSDELDLPVEDVALIKQLIGKNPMPLVVGQAFEMLES